MSAETKVQVKKSDAEWRHELSPEQYRILRQKGTEPAFTGAYWKTKDDGTYVCAACGNPLFNAATKYDSRSGWPSFYQPVAEDRVATEDDLTHGMRRTEVQCAHCDSHLGHVFDDGPEPTGLRYCINSAALRLKPE